MDPNETQGAAPAAAPGPVVAPDGAQPVTAPARSDEALWNKQEVVDLKKDVRSVKKALEDLAPVLAGLRTQTTPETKVKPAAAPVADSDLAQQVATLRRENALNRAYADHGIKPGKQREFIERQATRLAPEEIGTFVSEYLAAVVNDVVPAAKPAPATTTAPSAVAGKPAGDTGAPGADGRAPITSDLAGIDPEVFRKLPLDQRRQMVADAMRRGGGARTKDALGVPDNWDAARAAKARAG